MEQHHARAWRGGDAAGLLVAGRVDHRDIVLAAHHHPRFLAIGGEEALVRRAADIGNAFDPVRGGIDERCRVRAIGDDEQRLVIRRKAQAMHVDLALVERRQDIGPRVA
ncbi:hypothetical protein D3C81_1336740 [compost metagenome]